MLTLIIVVLIILWLIGALGPSLNSNIPNAGGLVHLLLVIVLIVILLQILGINI